MVRSKRDSAHRMRRLLDDTDTSSAGWAATFAEHVDWWTFFEILLLHLFAPFSALPYVCLRGWSAVRNMNLLYFSFSSLPSTLFLQGTLLVWGNLLVYLLFQPVFESCDVDIKEVFFVPMALIMVHRSLVALKYAFMPSEDRQLLLTGEFSLAQDLNHKTQLLSAWVPLLEDVLDKELSTASTVTGVDIFQGSFSHDVRAEDSARAAQTWQNLLFQEDKPHELETFSVSPDFMLRCLWREAVNVDESQRSPGLRISLAMVVAFIPCLFRGAQAYFVTGSSPFSRDHRCNRGLFWDGLLHDFDLCCGRTRGVSSSVEISVCGCHPLSPHTLGPPVARVDDSADSAWPLLAPTVAA